MKEIPLKYNPQAIEDKWYHYWQEKGFFHSEPNPNKQPYTVVIPPPNVTGILHMGHVLNNTIQDILVRKARMEGKEACWVPGTDHASIATEAKVVALLKEKGIQKEDIGREEFLKHAWEWKEKYGGIILSQLRKLGASCDWERTRFTMEEKLSKAVTQTFVQLYEEGYIYRGHRMVNWDPKGKTALADDEVIHKEVDGKLYHIAYSIVDSDEKIIIATSRPETLLGDTAICVHPEDERYHHLKGKKAYVPLINREIPIIEDTYVSKDFGTGALKITPAHDPNDYELGQKHQLAVIDIFNEDGTLNEAAEHYVGKDRFEARKLIQEELEKTGALVKIENYRHSVGFSERTDAVVEPRISTQWFMKMQELGKPALDNVLNDTIQFHPPKFKNMYKAWMENVRDWCISRQLWWGHRIPAYYLEDGTIVVGNTPEEALQKAQALKQDPSLTLAHLRQDEDVLDTWFSSWLWPISVFDGLEDPNNPDIEYYYPTNDLVTAPEIIFFWVARMIIAGYKFRGIPPFKNVYFTGIVRDKQRRKMSKSLGNSPDPIELMNQYSTDGVRTGMLFSAPAGNDLLFDEKLCEQGRNFTNKLWNAFRLVHHWETQEVASSDVQQLAIEWMHAKMNQVLQTVEEQFSQFRLSDALMTLYKFTFDDFCGWYLELIKPGYQQPIAQETYHTTLALFEKLLQLLHPFMPFITEELWHLIKERKENDCITVSEWPQQAHINESILEQASKTFELISKLRSIRKQQNIPSKEPLEVSVQPTVPDWLHKFQPFITQLEKLQELISQQDNPPQGISFSLASCSFHITHTGENVASEDLEALSKELEHLKAFLFKTKKKLENEQFVANAPESVVKREHQKLADTTAKIDLIEERLKR